MNIFIKILAGLLIIFPLEIWAAYDQGDIWIYNGGSNNLPVAYYISFENDTQPPPWASQGQCVPEGGSVKFSAADISKKNGKVATITASFKACNSSGGVAPLSPSFTYSSSPNQNWYVLTCTINKASSGGSCTGFPPAK